MSGKILSETLCLLSAPLCNLRALLFIFVIFTLYEALNAQDCSGVTGTRDRNTGIETYGGIVASEDRYGLLIQKENNFRDTSQAPKYYLFISAGYSDLVPDTVFNTPKTLLLELRDDLVVLFNEVKCIKNPLGYCCSVGFQATLTEKQMRVIAGDPIVVFKVPGFVKTSFTEKKQKRMQNIINCLLYKH